MRAALRIDALICQPKAFDRPASNEVLTHDLLGVFRLNVTVPDSFGINNHHRAVFALIQTARLINPDLSS